MKLTDEQFKSELTALIPRLNRVARLVTRNRDTALDLVQETCFRILSKKHTYKHEDKFPSWAIIIMYRCYSNMIRKKNLIPADFLVNSNSTNDPFMAVVINDLTKALNKLKKEKPYYYRAIKEKFNGASFEEIRQKEGTAESTIHTRIVRGRKLLEELVEGNITDFSGFTVKHKNLF